MEKHLYTRLRQHTDFVYPNVAPSNYKTPCAVYQLLETDAFNTFDGYSDEAFVTIMIAVSSPVYSEAKALANSIKDSFRDWDEGGVQTVSWLNETAAVDNSTETTLHRFMLFFKLFVSDDQTDA